MATAETILNASSVIREHVAARRVGDDHLRLVSQRNYADACVVVAKLLLISCDEVDRLLVPVIAEADYERQNSAKEKEARRKAATELERTVAALKLAVLPDDDEIAAVVGRDSKFSSTYRELEMACQARDLEIAALGAEIGAFDDKTRYAAKTSDPHYYAVDRNASPPKKRDPKIDECVALMAERAKAVEDERALHHALERVGELDSALLLLGKRTETIRRKMARCDEIWAGTDGVVERCTAIAKE